MKKAIILLATALLSVGCSDYFDQKNDDTTIPAGRFYGDEGAFLSALTDVYTQLRSESLYGGTLNLTLLNVFSHEFQPLGANAQAAYDRDFSNENLKKQLQSMNQAAYKAVASCNKIIEEAEQTNVKFFHAGQKQMVTGECYALRASLQFDLMRLYHPLPTADKTFVGLPYITSFVQKDAPKLTSAQMLKAINADLNKADSLLAMSDPILNSTNPTVIQIGSVDRRLRTLQMNYYAVKALQARVALWEGNYERAYQCAEAVFDHQRKVDSRYQLFYYVTPGTYGSDFEFSREYIFGIATRPDGFTHLADQLNQQGLVVSPKLHDLYPDAADIRYRAWFKDNGKGAYTMTKFNSETILTGYVYSQKATETNLPATIPYIKIGEVALIAAESLTELGRLDEAQTFLKALETSKNIDYVTPLVNQNNISKTSLLQLIHQEYERDLFGEGQLYFLYKRLGEVKSPALPE